MTEKPKRTRASFEEAKAAAAPKGLPLPAYDDVMRRTDVLQTQVFEAIKEIIPGILPEGLSMLAGRPKVGKSWFGLEIATAVAAGNWCLGKPCEQGDVLGLFLEDSDRRMQNRMTKMLGAHKSIWPRFDYATTWPRLNVGGIDWMKRWIDGVAKPRLIIVDILQKVRPPKGRSQESQYESDYEALMSMQALAAEAKVAILVLHHQRKATADDLIDTVSGTLGLTGGVDHLMVLGKDPDGSRYIWGNGRECEEFKLAVQFDANMRLENLGLKMRDQMSPERLRILSVLAKAGHSMSIAAVAKAVDDDYANIKNLLSKMCRDGLIERSEVGLYRIASMQSDLPI
ncbi:AAA family ATPase [Bradyrhizobium japonicum]|uniref:AAA family ATPase n=1 Tax=Bradyrhizobium japonicum TaxID=375 RepID=UPI001BA4E385|nr:AAA family ATPase [Bradyrhizobium japonicum]MBR0994156.1 AAA family ATPase [Bradyrhizobium japonicum]